MSRGNMITYADFLTALAMLRDRSPYIDIIEKTKMSANTISRINAARKYIEANDIDGIMEAHNKNKISSTIYRYGSEMIYENLDRLTAPEEPKEEAKKTVPAWFAAGVQVLPEISAMLKTLALTIDTALDHWKEGGEL